MHTSGSLTFLVGLQEDMQPVKTCQSENRSSETALQ